MTMPTSPIMEHHVEISQLEGSTIVTVHELQPSMMQSALNAIIFIFTPYITNVAEHNQLASV